MDSCDKMLFYIVLFITHCVIMANFPKEWLGQYSRYDNEFHVLLNYEGKLKVFIINSYCHIYVLCSDCHCYASAKPVF